MLRIITILTIVLFSFFHVSSTVVLAESELTEENTKEEREEARVYTEEKYDISNDEEKEKSDDIQRKNEFMEGNELVPAQIGDQGDHITILKKNLTYLGYGNFLEHPSSNYDRDTETAVKEFQQKYGLNGTGNADKDTIEKIQEVLSASEQELDREEFDESEKTEVESDSKSDQEKESNPSEKAESTEEDSSVREESGLDEPRDRETSKEAELAKEEAPEESESADLSEKESTNNRKSLALTNSKNDALLLKKGVTDPKVKDFKLDLKKLGFLSLPNPNKFYGSVTEKSVKSFQEYYDLDITGIGDKSTLAKIEEILSSPFQTGKSHKDTIKLKKDLDKLGFKVFTNPTTYYGIKTEQIVKEFQEKYGLVVTGIADQKTRNKIQELITAPMSNGLYRDDVVDFKLNLKKLGFLSLPNPNNFYGSVTEKSVKSFQEYYDLDITGIGDKSTLEKVEEILSSPFQTGKSHKDTIKLKKDLDKLGYKVFTNPTTYYGTITERIVKEFQEKYSLVVTGIADQKTRNKIQELITAPMSNGLYRDDVVDFKLDLKKLGFLSLPNPNNFYGPVTEKSVKSFQEYYDLDITGIGDKSTLEKVEEILSSPFQIGKSHKDTIKLKKDLDKLGFKAFINPTNYYGVKTTKLVKDFQKYYGLTVNGIGDKTTLVKIEEVLSSPFQDGKSHKDTIKLKKDLDKLGFKAFTNPTNYYGAKTTKLVKEFQKYYGLSVNGIADKVTQAKIEEILSSPFQDGKSHKDTIKLKKDLEKLGFKAFINPTNYYGAKTTELVKKFQKSYGLIVSGIADAKTLAAIDKALEAGEKVDYTNYNLTLSEAVSIQMTAGAQTDSYTQYVSSSYLELRNGNYYVTADALNVRSGPGTNYAVVDTFTKGQQVSVRAKEGNWYRLYWVDAKKSDIQYYLNPNNFVNDAKQKFQFLDLTRSSNASKTVLNNYLKGKGTLAGQGQAFIDASTANGINDVYLISHAILETGNGGSTLAKGVKYNGVTVYNMYGIGAYDDCAIECGAKKAYEEGWTTPYKAIVGGSKFIGNSYVKSGQNTIYKMRWDPAAMASTGKYGKQYATDIGWASKQITTMYNLYQQLDSYSLYLDVPEYK